METAASYLILGILWIAVFIFSLVSMRRENQLGHPLRGIFWFTLAIVCISVVVLFADNLERVKELGIISRHVKAMILGF